MSQRIDPSHSDTKAFLKFLGPLMIVVGLGFAVTDPQPWDALFKELGVLNN